MEVWGEDYEFACDALPSPSQGAVSSADPHAFFSLLYSDEPQWDQCMTQGLEDLVECFGRSLLTHLTVTGEHDYGTADVWETVFRTFPALEELKIDGDLNSRATNVFRGLHAASMTSADSSVACRNLKRVGVEGLGMVEIYVAMEECLRYRAHKGVRLQILDLNNLSNEWI